MSGSKFKYMTEEQLARWTDRAYMPAPHKFYRPHYTQRLPASYRNTLDNAKAHQVEGRQVKIASYQSKQAIGYHLQPGDLDEIWKDVLRRIDEVPGMGGFPGTRTILHCQGGQAAVQGQPIAAYPA
ncbi:hypothetical protein K431DRAFT_289836 [Polychaeton citri CBS 116435]|uniref:Uncharacterized protein n=1 Tax=Polychaeton citri CBS 116435 TaxID=1314669 RepID=A0A9P4UJP3_9PEZI|nr:hypothetical protein K431DRAFT_289836 [Polychaeton citri CBS 116435]